LKDYSILISQTKYTKIIIKAKAIRCLILNTLGRILPMALLAVFNKDDVYFSPKISLIIIFQLSNTCGTIFRNKTKKQYVQYRSFYQDTQKDVAT
jgi:hypothetical protein